MPVEFPKFWPIVFLPLALFYMLFLALNSSVWEGDTSRKIIPPPPVNSIHSSKSRTITKSLKPLNSTHPFTSPRISKTLRPLNGALTTIPSTVLEHLNTTQTFITSSTSSNSSNATITTLPPSTIAIRELEPLTIHTNNGRLGNQMFLLAILFGLCAINKRNMTVMPHTMGNLSPYFDLKYPVVNTTTFVEKSPWSIGQYLVDKDRHIPINTNFITGAYYPVSFTFFEDFRDGVTKLFTFKPVFRQHAATLLRKYRTKYPSAEVFIGVHVRRGDYLENSGGVGWLKNYEARVVDIEYFQKAMDYFKKRYPSAVFLVVSDDRAWCRDNLQNLGMVVTPDSPSPGHDMAFLSGCDHTVMTYGTYGFWSAFLAGGEAVYFSDFVRPDTEFARTSYQENKLYLPDWVGISTTPPGYWNRTKIAAS